LYFDNEQSNTEEVMESTKMLQRYHNELERSSKSVALDRVIKEVLKSLNDSLHRMPRMHGGREGMTRVMRGVDSEWRQFAAAVPHADRNEIKNRIAAAVKKDGCSLVFKSAAREIVDMLPA